MRFPFPYQRERPLSSLSTLGVGGPAAYLTEARSSQELEQMLACAHSLGIAVLILGKGSNILFDDRGFPGLVIVNRIDYLHSPEPGYFCVGSGFSFARLGKLTVRQGWGGLGFAAGIPGSVGGAIYMNAGAHGEETGDRLVSVTYLNERGEKRIFFKQDLFFSYRTSCFQQLPGAIVEALFQLERVPKAEEKVHEQLHYRLATQPYKERSAGCAFRNPPGASAGKLIEECGLKGVSRGAAQVSFMHANFIVNQGGARAADILELIDHIQQTVYHKKNIRLEKEIRYIQYD